MSFNPGDVSYLKIYPPIGIARLGDSGFDLDTGKPDGKMEWFLPSELPGTEDMPDDLKGRFKDEKHRIKRQAVRFRVYAYDQSGKILGEVTSDKGYTITWSVHVANHKAAYLDFYGEYKTPKTTLRNPDVDPDKTPDQRTKLIVDPGVQKISFKDAPIDLVGDFYGSQAKPTPVNLGQIRTDDKGRLIFIAGAGYSRCVANPKEPHFQPDILSEFDSIDWVDDTCDGWVDVTVDHPGLVILRGSMYKSTILSAPPKFAWGVQAPTTLYDLIENIYNEHTSWRDHEGADFYQDIWPVVKSPYVLSWTNSEAYQGHGVSGKGNFLTIENEMATPGTATETIRMVRDNVLGRLRKPNYEDKDQATTRFMPRLSGNNGDAIDPGDNLRPGEEAPPIKRFAALSALQYSRFQLWSQGKFAASPAPWSQYNTFDDVPVHLQPNFLTRAVLDNAVGEPLYPGIEVQWSARKPEMYLFKKQGDTDGDNPFRINHGTVKPGHIGRGLSLPWQSDFDLCETHWWPSARPDDVINIQDFMEGVTEASAAHDISPNDISDSPFMAKIPDNAFIKYIAPKRKKWTRGLRETPDYPSEYYPGSTDMIHYWHYLGFVAKLPQVVVGEYKLPVWVESERRKIARDRAPRLGAFQLPFAT
ncbi:hypothetical protein HYDPIDRAFT_27377 [Hydnomerulius pinastri MD-312]|nr:hypothetical protein HYDPIDRAFT_27377 [Hydnomerulius pinastri MD-312]